MIYIRIIIPILILALAISASASISIYSEIEVRGEGHYAHPAFETRSSLYDVFESGLWKNGSVYYKSIGSLTPGIDSLESEVDAQGEGQYSMSAKGSQAAHKMSFSRLSSLQASNRASVSSSTVDTSMEMIFEGVGTERVLGSGDFDRFTSVDEKGYNGTGRLIRGIHAVAESKPADSGGERYAPSGDLLVNNTTAIENIVPVLPAESTVAQNITKNDSRIADNASPVDIGNTTPIEPVVVPANEIAEDNSTTEDEPIDNQVIGNTTPADDAIIKAYMEAVQNA